MSTIGTDFVGWTFMSTIGADFVDIYVHHRGSNFLKRLRGVQV